MRRKAEEKKGEGEDGEDGEGRRKRRRRRRKRKIVADGWADIEGSIRGPGGPKRNIFPL